MDSLLLACKLFTMQVRSSSLSPLTALVRVTGANNVVIVSGNNYAYDLSGIPNYALTGYNIVYNTHPYDFPSKQPSDWDSNLANLIGNYPIMATEFGDYSCNINQYEKIFFVNPNLIDIITSG